MTTYYVHDGASGAADGSSWEDAFTTLAAAVTAATTGGDIIYVSENHTETLGANTIYDLGGGDDLLNPVLILVASEADPPVLVDAPNTTTYNVIASTYLLTFQGNGYIYGLSASHNKSSVAINLGASTSASCTMIFENCSFASVINNTAGHIGIGGSASSSQRDFLVDLINCKFKFANAGQSINFGGGRCTIRATDGRAILEAGGTTPTDLIDTAVNATGTLNISGYDLSSITGNLVNTAGTSNCDILFSQCKLGSGVTVNGTAIISDGAQRVRVDACDTGDKVYGFRHELVQGYITYETTKILTGGASDGTTTISWRMTTNSNATTAQWYLFPLVSPTIAKWNDTIDSAITVTVEILHDSVTNLEDDEIWLVVEYQGTDGYTNALVASDKTSTPKTSIVSGPGNGSAQTAGVGSGSWTTTGLTNPNSQKLNVSFTPRQKGFLLGKIYIAKANYTVYVNPVLTVT